MLIVANWPLVSGREVPTFDAFAYFGPYHHLVSAFAREGRFLSWNPWSSAGSPDYAEPQVGAFSPILLVTAYLGNGTEVAFRAYWVLFWYLGGLGVIVLGRHLRAPRWGCFVAATGFCFSGWYIGHAEHTPTLYAYSCLPWIIWRADAAMRDHSAIAAAQAGALLGLSGLGGYPAMMLVNSTYITLWMLGRALTLRSSVAGTLRLVSRWALLLLIVAAVSASVVAPAMLPFFTDAAGYAVRTGELPRDVAIYNGTLRPLALVTFASPALSWDLRWTIDTDPSLRNIYLGAIVPILAAIALCRGGAGRRWHAWLAVLGALSLMCALSTVFPLRGWLYDCCVPFRYFRQAALFRAYFLFTLVALALFGAGDVTALIRLSRQSRRSLRAMMCRIFAVIVLTSGVALAMYGFVHASYPDREPTETAHAIVLWTMPLVVAAAVTCGVRTNTNRRRTLLVTSLVLLATVDAIWSARFGGPWLHAVNDAWYRASELRYMGLDLTRHALARNLEDDWNFNLWHKVPVLRRYTPFSNGWFDRLSRDPIFERAATQPDRIFFAAQPPLAAVDETVFAALLNRAKALGEPVFVRQDPAELLHTRNHDHDNGSGHANDNADAARVASLPAAAPIVVHVERYEPEELTFSTTVPPGGGWLLVTDRWARGWKATVNGTPTPVFVGDFVFRAVQVPAGQVQVRFTYERSHGLWLVAVSWSLCGLLLIVLPLGLAIRRG